MSKGYVERFNGELEANVAAVAVSLFVGGNIYLLVSERKYLKKGNHYSWTMPGGTREYGETVRNTGVREVLEETNLRIRKSKLKKIGSPIQVSKADIIQYFACNIDEAASWQIIVNTEPEKSGVWKWVDLNFFRHMEDVGVDPIISVHGHIESIKLMLANEISLLDKFSNDKSWLGWIHEKDLRRFYGFKG